MKFLDYIQGFRKGKGANEIEKEALVDPFLADAIDGYDSVEGNHCVHIIEMQTKVQSKRLPSKSKRVLRILAAAIVFLAIFSGYRYLSEDHNYNNLIAYLDITPEKENGETQVAIAENKQTLVQPEELAFSEQVEASQTPSIKEDDSESNTEYQAPALGAESINRVEIHSEELLDEASEKKEVSVSSEKEVSTEQIKDISTDASQSVTIALGQRKDTENRSSSISLNEVATSSSKNKAREDIIPKSEEKNNLSSGKQGSSKKQKSDTPKVDEKTNGDWFVGAGASATMYLDQADQQTSSLAQERKSKDKIAERSIPIIGQVNYNKYLKKNTKYPKDGSCSNVKGSVIVEFNVTKTGRPINIRVVKSLCPELDQEAIRLVRAGSNWTVSDVAVRLLIEFDSEKKNK